MPWWSWALVGYGGLVVVFAALLLGALATAAVQARATRRRLIRDAEWFLAEVALSAAAKPKIPS